MLPLSLGMTVFIVSTKGEHLLFVYCTWSSNRSVCHAISRFGRHLGPAWHTVPRSHVFSFSHPEAKHIVKIGIKQKDSDNSFKIRVPVQTDFKSNTSTYSNNVMACNKEEWIFTFPSKRMTGTTNLDLQRANLAFTKRSLSFLASFAFGLQKW